MSSECTEIAERLLRETGNCLSPGVKRKLYNASLSACREPATDSLVPTLIEDMVAYVPLSQLPEAWANILHIYCHHDYDRDTAFTPRHGWTVLDVGGFLGFYTLYAAKRVGSDGRVVVVEPNPFAREHLYRNIAANMLGGRVRVDPRAVADKDDAVTLHIGCYWANTSLRSEYVEEGPGSCGHITVAAATLERIAREHGLTRIDLAKIDVEGMEYEVLQGAEKMLAEGRIRRIIVEVHEHYASTHDIAALLEKHGYHVKTVRLGEDYGQALIYATL